MKEVVDGGPAFQELPVASSAERQGDKVNDLTKPERIQLEELETVISNGIQTFAVVGNALLAIREGHLYRAEHGTFEAYCQKKWGMTHRHANMLIESACVVATLGPIGPKPKYESVARLDSGR